MIADTRSVRTSVAPMATAAARPNPRILTVPMSSSMKLANTSTMIRAAAAMILMFRARQILAMVSLPTPNRSAIVRTRNGLGETRPGEGR